MKWGQGNEEGGDRQAKGEEYDVVILRVLDMIRYPLPDQGAKALVRGEYRPEVI